MTVSVQARYDQSNPGTTLGNNSFLTAVVSAFTGVSTFEGQTITAALSAPEVFSSFELLSDVGEGVPFAHLNFILFDENFNYVDGGFDKVTSAAATQHETLTLDITIPQRGYLFVYVSNESEWDVRTYFDELLIDHEHLDVIQHEDYYPFGLAHNQNAQQERSNKYLYQGKERQFDLGLGWDDFHARQYDAALGRWHVTDPAGQFASPYTAMGNNPVNYVDPDGEFAWFVPVIIGAAIGGAGYTANVAFSDGGFDNWNWGQFGLSVGIGAVSGAASYGIGSAFGPVGSNGFVGEIARAATHGHINMMIGNTFGQDPSFAAFASGALGSLTGSALYNAGPLAQIGGSALVGGTSAELSGGDFWRGAATGATVAGLNHGVHAGIEWVKDRALIREINNEGFQPVDLSDPSASYVNVMKALRYLKLYENKRLPASEMSRWQGSAPSMLDLFDFSNAQAGGWTVGGGGVIANSIYFWKPRGMEIMLQASHLPALHGVDARTNNLIKIYEFPNASLSARTIGWVKYSAQMHSYWVRARDYIRNGKK